MPTVIIPLGLIVKTNDAAAISAFQSLADKHNLGLNITARISGLMPLFMRYNSGEINEEVFEAHLLDFLTSEQKIFSLTDQVRKAQLQQKLTQEWKACWNAMCEVDQRALQILACFNERTDIELVVYSDSNPTHIKHISARLNIKPESIHTTFATGSTIPMIIIKLVDDCPDINNLKVLVGNPSHIKNPVLRARGEDKQQRILAVIPEQTAVIINSQYLEPMELLEIFKAFPKVLAIRDLSLRAAIN